MLLAFIESQAVSGGADESGEAGVEVPEAVTVEIEEIHPLPEVSAIVLVVSVIFYFTFGSPPFYLTISLSPLVSLLHFMFQKNLF